MPDDHQKPPTDASETPASTPEARAPNDGLPEQDVVHDADLDQSIIDPPVEPTAEVTSSLEDVEAAIEHVAEAVDADIAQTSAADASEHALDEIVREVATLQKDDAAAADPSIPSESGTADATSDENIVEPDPNSATIVAPANPENEAEDEPEIIADLLSALAGIGMDVDTDYSFEHQPKREKKQERRPPVELEPGTLEALMDGLESLNIAVDASLVTEQRDGSASDTMSTEPTPETVTPSTDVVDESADQIQMNHALDEEPGTSDGNAEPDSEHVGPEDASDFETLVSAAPDVMDSNAIDALFDAVGSLSEPSSGSDDPEPNGGQSSSDENVDDADTPLALSPELEAIAADAPDTLDADSIDALFDAASDVDTTSEVDTQPEPTPSGDAESSVAEPSLELDDVESTLQDIESRATERNAAASDDVRPPEASSVSVIESTSETPPESEAAVLDPVSLDALADAFEEIASQHPDEPAPADADATNEPLTDDETEPMTASRVDEAAESEGTSPDPTEDDVEAEEIVAESKAKATDDAPPSSANDDAESLGEVADLVVDELDSIMTGDFSATDEIMNRVFQEHAAIVQETFDSPADILQQMAGHLGGDVEDIAPMMMISDDGVSPAADDADADDAEATDEVEASAVDAASVDDAAPDEAVAVVETEAGVTNPPVSPTQRVVEILSVIEPPVKRGLVAANYPLRYIPLSMRPLVDWVALSLIFWVPIVWVVAWMMRG